MACPKCASVEVEGYSTLHHYPCSYIGPQYDFGFNTADYICPKCKIILENEYNDWEIVGFCCKCGSCGEEFIDDSF
jgi:hypothetical protein